MAVEDAYALSYKIEFGSHISSVHGIPSSHEIEAVLSQLELLQPLNINFNVDNEHLAFTPLGPSTKPLAHAG
jgi:hypothetical protein